MHCGDNALLNDCCKNINLILIFFKTLCVVLETIRDATSALTTRETRKVFECGARALRLGLRVGVFPALQRPDVNCGSRGYNTDDQSRCCCCSCCGGGVGSPFAGDMKTVGVFFHLKRSSVREKTALKKTSPVNNLASFFEIVICASTGFSPLRNMGLRNVGLFSHHRTLTLSHLSHWFLDKN